MRQFYYRLFTILIITIFSIIGISCSQNTSKPANYSGNNNSSTEKANSATMMTKNNSLKPSTNDDDGKLAKPNQLLPEISEKYSGVKIMLVDKKNDSNKLSQVVPFNKRTSIEGSDIEVTVLSFFTQFTLADNGMVKNVSMKENNPAAKVSLFKKGELVFDGWLFQNYPEMHNYDDDIWQILLVGGMAK